MCIAPLLSSYFDACKYGYNTILTQAAYGKAMITSVIVHLCAALWKYTHSCFCNVFSSVCTVFFSILVQYCTPKNMCAAVLTTTCSKLFKNTHVPPRKFTPIYAQYIGFVGVFVFVFCEDTIV